MLRNYDFWKLRAPEDEENWQRQHDNDDYHPHRCDNCEYTPFRHEKCTQGPCECSCREVYEPDDLFN